MSRPEYLISGKKLPVQNGCYYLTKGGEAVKILDSAYVKDALDRPIGALVEDFSETKRKVLYADFKTKVEGYPQRIPKREFDCQRDLWHNPEKRHTP